MQAYHQSTPTTKIPDSQQQRKVPRLPQHFTRLGKQPAEVTQPEHPSGRRRSTASQSLCSANLSDLKSFGADYGLFVSWSGFTPPAKSEARKSAYFNVRLWDSEAFLNSLFEHYDRLPASLRAELPIRQIWILDEPDA